MLFSRLAQAENWTKTKDFWRSFDLYFLMVMRTVEVLGKTSAGLLSAARGISCCKVCFSFILTYNFFNLIYLICDLLSAYH